MSVIEVPALALSGVLKTGKKVIPGMWLSV